MMNMGKILKQVSKMKDDMTRAQEELAQERVEGSSGGGMVRAIVRGTGELDSITLDREVVDPPDIEMLQDLIVAAVHDAQQKAEELREQKMGSLTQGMDLPGLGL